VLRDAHPAFVVAELRAGNDIPRPASCDEPDVICMDPPSFYLEAKVLAQIYGDPVPRKLHAATTSHFGKQRYRDDRGPYLLRLISNGTDYVMSRYAATRVEVDRSGKFHLMVHAERGEFWLPCSMINLRREVDPRDFPKGLSAHEVGLARERITEYPELFRLTPKGAMPRYSILIDELREHLATLRSDAPLACESN
jgi:hypothetical protein